MGEDATLGAAVADAGYWSEANADSQTEECELFIATRKDREQRAGLRDATPPRGRIPKGLSARGRMERKLRTKRGRAIYRRRGASVEPVFGQMKERQGAGRFSMRGLDAMPRRMAPARRRAQPQEATPGVCPPRGRGWKSPSRRPPRHSEGRLNDAGEGSPIFPPGGDNDQARYGDELQGQRGAADGHGQRRGTGPAAT